ncbi:unnamed protein product [Larinioides sclopetarius]|uniref:EGF-like domain-containing protein n=2 Tax=Larinioides sclopetarius TaxID=280406 RepID=A0AAV2B6M1_9ARAC
MCTFKIFDKAFIFCVSIFITVEAEHYFRLGVSTWNHDILDSFSVFNKRESLDYFSDTDLDVVEGCRCKNGRCEKLCVKERNGVCRRTENVCVCDPEFVKINDETCIYCGCGKGFNCTFYHVTRTCVCPEGFYIHDDKCAAECSESKSCQNGGKCVEGRCECKLGTSGAFCESLDGCPKTCNQPLLVECFYDDENEEVSCRCKNRSLVYDIEKRICKPCPCGAGSCMYNDRKLTCHCDPGYQEFNGQCRPCDCGRNGRCEINKRGEMACHCKNGDFSRQGKCLPCDCGHKDAKCETNKEGRKVCRCPYGYEDILGKCIKMNKVDRKCLCHPTANCVETNDDSNEFNCTCNEGYKGKNHDIPQVGEECIDIDECQDSQTCPDRDTTECVNFKGSYMCRCKTGYQPTDKNADPRKTACEKYKISWAPTGIVIGIIVAFIAISVGVLFYLKQRSTLLSSTSGIEMQHADYKR